MEQNSELVELGKILDETSYIREKKSILIDNTINIDFIKNNTVIHEVKKTRAIEEAGEWQIKYYIYYLEQKGVKNIEAVVDYPLLKQKREIFLTEEDRKILKDIIEQIKKTMTEERPQETINNKICKKCAYYDFCYI